MVANFFKQSKPIVFLILGVILSLLYYTKIVFYKDLIVDAEQLIVILINHLILISSFILLESSIKKYEIQKGHSLASLFFVLFAGTILPGVDFSHEFLGFLILSLGVVRILAITESAEKNMRIYEAVLLISVASLFYKPIILCLFLVLAGSLLFSRPKWRYFIIPVFSISTVVIFVECYFLFKYDSIAEWTFFIPELEYSLEAFRSKFNPILASFWLLSSLTCFYQIFKVKRIRSLYHRNMASFFLIFLGLAFLSIGFKSSTLSGLWLVSIWPLCIYLGDFISRIKKRFWLQVWFWGFVVASLSIYLYQFDY